MKSDSRQPYEIARDYLGVPFQHRGRTEAGVDCAGLLVLVALKRGYPVKDLTIYGREPQNDGLYEFLRLNCGEPKPEGAPLEVNDILLLRHKPGKPPNHLALVTPHPHGLGIIHSYGEVGRVVEHGLTGRRLANITGVWQWPERV